MQKIMGQSGDYLLVSVSEQNKEAPALGVIANTRKKTVSKLLPLLMLFSIKQWDDVTSNVSIDDIGRYEGW